MRGLLEPESVAGSCLCVVRHIPFQQAVRDLSSSQSVSAAFTNVSDVRMSTNVLVEHDRDLPSSVHGRRSHSISMSNVYKLTSARNGLQKAEAKGYSYTGAQQRIVRVRLRKLTL